MSSGEYDQANRKCGEVIATTKQPGESPERSSFSLVDVVCTHPARLPIQLSLSLRRQSRCFPFQAIEILDRAAVSNLP
jgi:hypothetical protein